MARIGYVEPIEAIHGKIKKDSNVSHRGKFTYTLQHPRKKEDFSEHEKAYHCFFGEKNKEASRINKDEALAAAYNDWKEKGYQSRYRYILACLVAGK